MDPLSLSASIAGLVALADLVFRTATKYVKAVQRSQKELEGFLSEVKTFSVLLHELSLIAFDLESEPSDDEAAVSNHPSVFKPHHLYECQQLLRRLERGLDGTQTGFSSHSVIEKLHNRLKWPFSSTETKDMLKDIERHKQTINIAIAADSMSKLRECLSRQQDANTKLNDLQVITKVILDIQTRISLDTKRNLVLGFFTKVNPRSEFEMNRNLRHPLTGLWLTESPEFDEWYDTPGSRTWFTGIPGAGKSVIASAIISECLQRNRLGAAVGYFFCTYRDQTTHHCSNILSSLCVQLALQEETAYQALEEYYDQLHSNHLPGEPANLISLALLSRYELHIRERVQSDFQCIELEAHTEDIQRYVLYELEERIKTRRLRLRDIAVKDQIMTKLISGAKGMFRWVTCQLDHICELLSDRARRDALDKLPPTLPATYERILVRVDSHSKDIRSLVQRTLLLVGSSVYRKEHNLSFKELCEAVSLSDDSDTLHDDEIVDEEEILRWCGSLVRTSCGGTVLEFAHFTVQEFLQGDCQAHSTLDIYGISEEKTSNLLGPLCLRFLTLRNLDEAPGATERGSQLILERRKTHPFYEHAAMYWSYYVHQQTRREQVAEHLSALFQTPKTPHFCWWAIEFMRHCLWESNRYFQKRDDFGEGISDLGQAGVVIGEQDLNRFHEFYQSVPYMRVQSSEWQQGPGKSLIRLVKILAQTGRKNDARSRLFSVTLEFLKRVDWATHQDLLELQSDDTMSDEDVRQAVKLLIEANDVIGLERLFKDHPLEFVELAGIDPNHPDWTPLHLATSSKALDVLTFLLKLGLDPNLTDESGRTPVLMCSDINDQDMLRVLLQHGASTAISDEHHETIWHMSARKSSLAVLMVLLELDDSDRALQMVSKKGETPMCVGLSQRWMDYTLALVKHCHLKEHWKSPGSIFRVAATLGCSEVIQKLLDVGVEIDGWDDDQGSALHSLDVDLNLESIQALAGIFPIEQRRKSDLRTPLQLILLRAAKDRRVLHHSVFTALLPGSTRTDSSEAAALWSFLCAEVAPITLATDQRHWEFNRDGVSWLRDIFCSLVQLRMVQLYEKQEEVSA
ncbi:hypothetical protein QQX98_002577 [Neonectria punicea]|uniref:Nephrocystin 3-like N-terminal domain-containing protein n=1 Tax=Neonectria punicea TaxID=979145 RepID=A0ABR1HHU1_9HYPO